MKTEQRYLLAIVLSFLVLMVFYTPLFNPKQTKPLKSAEEQQTAPGQPTAPAPAQDVVLGVAKQPVTARTYALENDVFLFHFTSVGAAVSELVLKNAGHHKNGGPVDLIKPAAGVTPAFAIEIQNQPVSLAQADFALEGSDSQKGTISFVLELPGQWRVRKRYELIPSKFALRVTAQFENLSERAKQIPLEFYNQLYLGKERGRYDQDQLESFVALKLGKIQVAKAGKMKKNSVVVSEPLEWQALTKQYFTVIVKPDKISTYTETGLTPGGESMEAKLRFAPETVEPNSTFETSFLIYAGPEYYEDLKSFGFGFEQTLTQGTWGLFRYWLFVSLRFCQKVTGNYGFAILLATLLIKILFSPFTHMSFGSMRKMQVIQPKMKAIQTQFKNDPPRMNKEMTELYRRHKVNPMGGCLPMLIQIPIFIGFYQVLAQFVEIKGESLWWIQDLTQPDRLAKIPYFGFDLNLLPLVMIGTMLWQQKVTPQQNYGSPAQTKMMLFVMPIVFGFLFYQMPSGLVLYWTLNNLLTVIHQVMFHHGAKPLAE